MIRFHVHLVNEYLLSLAYRFGLRTACRVCCLKTLYTLTFLFANFNEIMSKIRIEMKSLYFPEKYHKICTFHEIYLIYSVLLVIKFIFVSPQKNCSRSVVKDGWILKIIVITNHVVYESKMVNSIWSIDKVMIFRKAKREAALRSIYPEHRQAIVEHMQSCFRDETAVTVDSLHDWACTELLDFTLSPTQLYYGMRGMGFHYRMKYFDPMLFTRNDLIQYKIYQQFSTKFKIFPKILYFSIEKIRNYSS